MNKISFCPNSVHAQILPIQNIQNLAAHTILLAIIRQTSRPKINAMIRVISIK